MSLNVLDHQQSLCDLSTTSPPSHSRLILGSSAHNTLLQRFVGHCGIVLKIPTWLFNSSHIHLLILNPNVFSVQQKQMYIEGTVCKNARLSFWNINVLQKLYTLQSDVSLKLKRALCWSCGNTLCSQSSLITLVQYGAGWQWDAGKIGLWINFERTKIAKKTKTFVVVHFCIV